MTLFHELPLLRVCDLDADHVRVVVGAPFAALGVADNSADSVVLSGGHQNGAAMWEGRACLFHVHFFASRLLILRGKESD